MKVAPINIFKYFKEYGLIFSTQYYYASYKKNYKERHTLVDSYLSKAYLPYIHRYKSPINHQDRISLSDYKVWVLWWQGKNDMPPIVKICFNSLQKNIKDIPLVLITKENFYKYVDLPKYITEKIKKDISITHLSDILRFALLSKYGGLWIDATVLLTKNITDINIMFELDTFTAKISNMNKKSFNIAYDRWTGFLMANNIYNNFLFDCGKSLFFQFWKKHSILIDYFLIDYFINILYKNNLFVQNMIDKIPINNTNIFVLNNLLNKNLNMDTYDKLIEQNNFHKLSWKEYINYDAKNTYYQYLKSLYL